jgi:hypothetical protein
MELALDDKQVTLELASRAYEDPVFFCRFFLRHLFPSDMPWVHRGLLAILTGKTGFLWKYGEVDKIVRNFVYKKDWDRADSELVPIFTVEGEKIKIGLSRYTLIMMPRGASKTTLAGIAVPLYNILYNEVPFTVYVSEAAPHAKGQLHNVQRELTDNPKIQGVFGEMKPELRDDEKWTGDFFETKTGVAFAARGRGGQIRGLNHRGNRPTMIICDDLEDKESVDTELQREKTRTWAYGDLMPALPEIGESGAKGTIVALGTLLHRESLLETWKRDPEWTVVQFGIKDRDGDWLWPVYMDGEKYERRKVSATSAGQLHTFYMEYHNEYMSPEQQTFKPHYLKYNSQVDDILFTAIYCDPAISDKRHADDTAIVVGGITKKGVFRVLECEGRRGMPDLEKVTVYFELQRRWNCRVAGVEATAYQAALIETMRLEMFRRKQYFEITPVLHKTKKNSRIKGVLQPRYSAGYIEHRIRFPKLEAQLLDFREDTDDQPDDYIDAAAACLQLLDPYAGLAAGDMDEPEKDTMEPLDEVFDGDWRWA